MYYRVRVCLMLGRDFVESTRRWGEAAIVAWSYAGPRWNDPGLIKNSSVFW